MTLLAILALGACGWAIHDAGWPAGAVIATGAGAVASWLHHIGEAM